MDKQRLYKKKILLLTEAFDEGGTEIAMLSLINQLKKFECEVEILCINKEGILLERFVEEVPIREIIFSNKYWKKIALNIQPRWKNKEMLIYNIFFVCCKKLFPINQNRNKLYEKMIKKSLKQKEKWDIVFDFYGYGSFLTAYAIKSIKADIKATWVHGTAIHSWRKVSEYLPEFRKIYCVSKAVVNVFNKKFPNLKEITEVLYNATDIQEIIKKSKEPVENIRKKDRFTFLTIGRLELIKEIDFAIRVAKKLKENNIEFMWYVIGDGTLREFLQNMIESEKIQESFKLLGRRNNVYPYLTQCDVYIQTSSSEGYSTTILEARALKCVVVATDIDSNREQIKNGKTGYLVEHQEEKFVKTIQKIISNGELRRRIIRNLEKEKINFLEEIEKFEKIL